MAEKPTNVESIFEQAVEFESVERRRKFLDDACGTDQILRARVEALLRANDDAGSFLQKPPEGLMATIATGDFDTADKGLADVSLEFLKPSEKVGCLGTIGQYEVVEVIGRGGMGIVLRAYDTKLNRVVAIKVMAPELAANPMGVKRFLREARAAAAISHEHVVTIHAIEEEHSPPFIVMEFIDGKSLQEKVDAQGALELKEILRISMQIARGLAAAHEQGLVHRDIKPANILLENGVERVKLTDFGLARATDDVSVTQTGQIAGTPQYMSPEQAEGGQLDARSDLFSLGSVLYTMCTGRPPFRADTAVAMLRRVTDDDPRPIRQVNAEIPEWLDAITSKLLEKDPDHRFQSASEVSHLLSQHLAHLQDPAATPLPTLPIDQTNVRKHPWKEWASTTAWCLTFLVLFAAARMIWKYQPDQGSVMVDSVDEDASLIFNRIRRETTDGSKRNVTIRPSESVSHRGSGRVILRSGRYSISLGADKDKYTVSQSFFTIDRGGEITVKVRRRVANHPAMRLERRLQGHLSTVTSVDISPDGRYALTARGWPRSARNDNGVLRLWDFRTAREIRKFNGVVRPYSARFSPDGTKIIVGGKTPDVFVFDVESGRKVAEFSGLKSGHHVALALTPDGRHALIGESVGSVHIGDLDTGEIIHTLEQPDDKVMSLDVSPDGTYAVATSGDEVYVWNLVTRNFQGRFRKHEGLVYSVAFSHDGTKVVSAGQDKTVRVWDVKSRKELQVFRGHSDAVLCAKLTPGDGFVVSAGHDCTIRHWNVASGKQVLETKATGCKSIWSIAISPDGKHVLASGGQKSESDRSRVKHFDPQIWRVHRSVAQSISVFGSAEDGWVDLLQLASIDQGKADAEWRRNGTGIALVSGNHSPLKIPVDVGPAYELRSRFRRNVDGGSIKFWLPMQRGYAELSFNDWYKYHGIQYLNGKMMNERQSGPALATGKKFVVGEAHEMSVRVQHTGDQVRIVLLLDGSELFDWTGSSSSIMQQNPHVQLKQPNGIALGTGQSPGIVWDTLEFRPLRIHPFAVKSKGGDTDASYANLMDAVNAAKDGDTIDVRGNGPFVTEPIIIRKRALTIRASMGSRPVIELSPNVKDATPMIDTHSPLFLEGLTFVRVSEIQSDDEDLGYRVINSFQAPLFVSNCEFRNRFVSIRAYRSPECQIQNCIFIQPKDAIAFTPTKGSRLSLKNNLAVGALLHLHCGSKEASDVAIDMTHNTILGRLLWLFLHERPLSDSDTPRIRIELNNNILQTKLPMIHFARSGKLLQEREPLSASEMRQALQKTVEWKEGRNLFALRDSYLETGSNSRPKIGAPFSIRTQTEWQLLWNLGETKTILGQTKFAGGDLRRLSHADLTSLTEEAFRIVSGPAARASDEGKNLGIAVNYIGPDGLPRWKATPTYNDVRAFEVFQNNSEPTGSPDR